MEDRFQTILAPVQADQTMKAHAWELQNVADEKEFNTRLSGIDLPSDVKANLWESKFGTGASAPPKPQTTQDILAHQAAKYPTPMESKPSLRFKTMTARQPGGADSRDLPVPPASLPGYQTPEESSAMTPGQTVLEGMEHARQGIMKLPETLSNMIPDLVHGVVDTAKKFPGTGIIGPAITAAKAIKSDPNVTALRGAGALAAPEHVTAPTPEEWASAQEAAGQNLALTAIPPLADLAEAKAMPSVSSTVRAGVDTAKQITNEAAPKVSQFMARRSYRAARNRPMTSFGQTPVQQARVSIGVGADTADDAALTHGMNEMKAAETRLGQPAATAEHWVGSGGVSEEAIHHNNQQVDAWVAPQAHEVVEGSAKQLMDAEIAAVPRTQAIEGGPSYDQQIADIQGRWANRGDLTRGELNEYRKGANQELRSFYNARPGIQLSREEQFNTAALKNKRDMSAELMYGNMDGAEQIRELNRRIGTVTDIEGSVQGVRKRASVTSATPSRSRFLTKATPGTDINKGLSDTMRTWQSTNPDVPRPTIGSFGGARPGEQGTVPLTQAPAPAQDQWRVSDVQPDAYEHKDTYRPNVDPNTGKQAVNAEGQPLWERRVSPSNASTPVAGGQIEPGQLPLGYTAEGGVGDRYNAVNEAARSKRWSQAPQAQLPEGQQTLPMTQTPTAEAQTTTTKPLGTGPGGREIEPVGKDDQGNLTYSARTSPDNQAQLPIGEPTPQNFRPQYDAEFVDIPTFTNQGPVTSVEPVKPFTPRLNGEMGDTKALSPKPDQALLKAPDEPATVRPVENEPVKPVDSTTTAVPDPAPRPKMIAERERVRAVLRKNHPNLSDKSIESTADDIIAAGTQTIPDGRDELRSVAEDYSKGKGLKPVMPSTYIADENLGKKVADFYNKAKSNPKDPAVKAAYTAMNKEVEDQYQHLTKSGYKFEPTSESAPYNSYEDMLKDLIENKHLKVWNGGTPEHGMMTAEQNWKFRAVHDSFGHILSESTFGFHGEEGAYRSHLQMFTSEAQKAMATETRGQNMTVHFGSGNAPETIYEDKLAGEGGKLKFPEQKAVILPDEFRVAPGELKQIVDMHKEFGGSTTSGGKTRAGENAYAVAQFKEGDGTRRVKRLKVTPTEEDIKSFKANNDDLLKDHKNWAMGTWAETKPVRVKGKLIDKPTGDHILDVVKVIKDRKAAIASGNKTAQDAITYLKDLSTVNLKGLAAKRTLVMKAGK